MPSNLWPLIRSRTRSSLAVTLFVVAFHTAPLHAQWPQWGGPNRDFRVDLSGVADDWPQGGPAQIWKRALGDGYTSVVVDEGRLYTAYRRTPTTNEEVVVALAADTGKTLWEYRIPSPARRVGPHSFGPNSTMLIVGDKLYYTSVHAALHCLDARTGKRIWERDLGGTADAPIPDGYGYTCSPIAFGPNVIVTADRDTVDALRPSGDADVAAAREDGSVPHTLVAFHKDTGDVAWTGGRFTMGHSSPILIEFRGETQLVLFTMDGLFGVSPVDGSGLWHHELRHENTNDAIITPLWNGTDLLFCSSHGTNSGSRVIRLIERDGKTTTREQWFDNKVFFGMHVPALVGDCLVGANDTLMLGADIKTGRRLWRERGYRQGACLYADGRMLFLGMDGRLTLASVSCDGMVVRSQFQAAEEHAFTPPTLVGSTLYLRDRKHVTAFDLGK